MLKVHSIFSRFIVAFLLAGSISPQANAETGDEEALKTAFLFNFFKFIEWTETESNQAYSLCTVNNDHLGDSLIALENKTIRSKALVIRRGISGQDLKNCHMVFISAAENATDIIRDLKDLPIVTISDKPDFIGQGGIIGLEQDEGHLSFVINLSAAKAVNIYINAQLLKLAKRVFEVN
ncbi:MAG: YfiR family protein [Methylococcales bacterium]